LLTDVYAGTADSAIGSAHRHAPVNDCVAGARLIAAYYVDTGAA